MVKRYIVFLLTLFPLISFWGCEKISHQGSDPDEAIPSVEWTAIHMGGDPWGLNYTPDKTYYWGNYPVSACKAKQGCQKITEFFPGKISIKDDREFVLEVKCNDSYGISRVIGNYENPRYQCDNYDYYLDNGNDNPNDDPGLSFTFGSIHENAYFFFQDNRWTPYGDDFRNYEFGFGLSTRHSGSGFSYFNDNGIPSNEVDFDRVAGDNIWTSYLPYLSNEKSTYRNFKSPDEIQYLIVRSYYDQDKSKMCNWRLFFFAENNKHFGIQGVLPELWLEITE